MSGKRPLHAGAPRAEMEGGSALKYHGFRFPPECETRSAPGNPGKPAGLPRSERIGAKPPEESLHCPEAEHLNTGAQT